MTGYIIELIDPKEADELINKLDEYCSGLYPPEDNYFDSIETLSKDNVRMYGCRIKGRIIATGAVKFMDGYGEIKRIFVLPEFRGNNIAEKIIRKLEEEAGKMELRHLRLETGIYQPEALGMFKKCGFIECGVYGEYTDNPHSIFMEKNIG